MACVQLEFNIDNLDPEDLKVYQMQMQIDKICESMGKVRKKLFAELNEVKKLCSTLKQENEDLKETINKLNKEKTDWKYVQDGFLFYPAI